MQSSRASLHPQLQLKKMKKPYSFKRIYFKCINIICKFWNGEWVVLVLQTNPWFTLKILFSNRTGWWIVNGHCYVKYLLLSVLRCIYFLHLYLNLYTYLSNSEIIFSTIYISNYLLFVYLNKNSYKDIKKKISGVSKVWQYNEQLLHFIRVCKGIEHR